MAICIVADLGSRIKIRCTLADYFPLIGHGNILAAVGVHIAQVPGGIYRNAVTVIAVVLADPFRTDQTFVAVGLHADRLSLKFRRNG